MKNTSGKGVATYTTVPVAERGTGPGSAGQSGDTQGLPERAEADSESVTELVEEGQYLEAELIEGMEETPEGEVRTTQDRRGKALRRK